MLWSPMGFLSMLCSKLIPSFILSTLLTTFRCAPEQKLFHQPVSIELYRQLSSFAHLMDIAYCISPITKIQPPFQCENSCDDFPTFEVIDQWAANDIKIIPSSFETSGYIALDKAAKKVYVVLRGTRSFKDTLIDFSADMVEYVVVDEGHEDTEHESYGCELRSGGCKIHRGFYESYRLTLKRSLPTLIALKELIQKREYKVVILGHSLGGAISVLLSVKIMKLFGEKTLVDCITMGQPMIGNENFNAYINRRFNMTGFQESEALGNSPHSRILRVTHLDDPIVKLPIDDHHFIGDNDYGHFNGEIFINQLGSQAPALENVYYCHGNVDPECSYGMGYSKNNYEHMNYFRRMGRCGFGYQ